MRIFAFDGNSLDFILLRLTEYICIYTSAQIDSLHMYLSVLVIILISQLIWILRTESTNDMLALIQ